MKPLYNLAGCMVALDRILIIGTIDEVKYYYLDEPIYQFELVLTDSVRIFSIKDKDLNFLTKERADLIDAFNLYHQNSAPPVNGHRKLKLNASYPAIGEISIGEVCLICRHRAGLSLVDAGAAAWPDLKAGHQKLKKIEAGTQVPTDEDLECLAKVLDAPELASNKPDEET